MANETSVSAALSNSKNTVTISQTATKVTDMAGDPVIEDIQIVGTTTEALLLGDVTNPGYVLLKNLDATNYVEIGLDTPVSQIFAKLLAGECALFPAKTATMYAKANTNPVNVLVVVVSR